uniref:Group 21 allergen n=1 Tax=Dermatophagoides farinae TaxID=6954 RepID=A8B8F7_DERFA|nr:group 21 allergen [Dermatophagoides farinae]ABO84965.1 group 21 allergen [Dermatophagoides farinae]
MKFIIFCAIVMAVSVSGFIVDVDTEDKWRNAFDRMLMEEFEEKMDQIEHGLLMLSEQYKELEKTKSKELKEQILRELTIAENYLRGALKFMQQEAKRTDLNMFERYNFETAVSTIEILVKDLAELAKKVKAVKSDD